MPETYTILNQTKCEWLNLKYYYNYQKNANRLKSTMR